MDIASSRAISRIVIVGGGTAGWLAARRIAAAARLDATDPIDVPPEVATIGVGDVPIRAYLDACRAACQQAVSPSMEHLS